ncbi:MAG: Hint domain-containing protein [Planctomycetota bacterium]
MTTIAVMQDMPKRWHPLRLHPALDRLSRSTARFDVIEAARRCLAEGTLVATPTGPRPIESLCVGDHVIGFDGEKPVVTTVTKTWDNGEQSVVGLFSRDRCYVEATENHRLWASKAHSFDPRKANVKTKFKRMTVDALSNRTRVARVYLGDMIAGGQKHVERTYSLGALLGDGCSRANKTTTGVRQRVLHISSEDGAVPGAIAAELGCAFDRVHASNYTWAIRVGRGALDAVPFYRQWCAGRYAHEKIVDWNEVDTWDRESCLALLAGVIDTDGCVHFKTGGHSEVVVQIGMQARAVVEACQKIITKYFQERCQISVDNRQRYKNGPVYCLKSTSNDLALRLLEALGPHLRKRGAIDTSNLKRSNIRSDRIGLLPRGARRCRTFDITVALPTNLYVLHVGGLVTSNSGKDEFAKRKGIIEARAMSQLYGRWYAKYCAPTLRQARDIYWDDLRDMSAPFWEREPNKTDLCIYLRGGAEIWVCGLDKPQRIEGSPVNRLVVTELADVKDGAWERHLRPALDTEQEGYPAARAWLMGVPRPGAQFAKLARMAKDPTEPDYAYHHWTSEAVLSREKIAAAKRTMDPRIYAQEYLAQRVAMDGRAYYQFSDSLNVRALDYQPHLPLLFCFDFNRSPGVAVVAQEQALSGLFVAQCLRCGAEAPGLSGEPCAKCHNLLPMETCSCAIGEVHIETGSNTTMVCDKLCADWGHHKGQVLVFGDATGGAKKSSSTEGSDWDLVKRYLARTFPQAAYDVDASNPSPRARVNAVNLRACNAAGERRLFVDPRPGRAPNLARDLTEQMVIEGTTGELDKDSDLTLGHASDGLGYCIHKLYPADYGNESSNEAA